MTFPSLPPQESAGHCLRKDMTHICWMCSSALRIRRKTWRTYSLSRGTVSRLQRISLRKSRILTQSGRPDQISPAPSSDQMSSNCAVWRILHFSGFTAARVRTASSRPHSTCWASATPGRTLWAAPLQWIKDSQSRSSFSPASTLRTASACTRTQRTVPFPLSALLFRSL